MFHLPTRIESNGKESNPIGAFRFSWEVTYSKVIPLFFGILNVHRLQQDRNRSLNRHKWPVRSYFEKKNHRNRLRELDLSWQLIIRDFVAHAWTEHLMWGYSISSETSFNVLVYCVTLVFLITEQVDSLSRAGPFCKTSHHPNLGLQFTNACSQNLFY